MIGAAISTLVARVRTFGVEGVFGRFYGIYTAVVEDVEDPEGVNRIRVRVHALGQRKAPEALWARPAVFGGSEGTGVFFAPSVGDRVWVSFVAGDPGKPVYLGGFMGFGKAPDEFRNQLHRGVKTPSGHVIRMSDEEGEEEVLIRSSAGAEVVMEQDGAVAARSDGGSEIRLSAGGDAEVEDASGARVTLSGGVVTVRTSAGATLTLDGTTATLKGMEVKVEATRVQLAAGVVDIGNGAAQPLVLGPALLAALNSHVHVGNLGAPTGPPLVPFLPSLLSRIAKTG